MHLILDSERSFCVQYTLFNAVLIAVQSTVAKISFVIAACAALEEYKNEGDLSDQPQRLSQQLTRLPLTYWEQR